VYPEDFAALPAELRDELERAVLSLDHERIALAVDRISEQNTSLASALARLAGKLLYTPIFNALEGCKARSPQQNA
jgi:hypothetical protein